ncbi:universal stress protein [Sphingobacterium sp. SYP-B4668]|uniref:universal stress protein n=1 Tax=Sphingobacterium sp. SYP-B4668 TaxID=2996035 RepID=UPI0022DD4121|nr:universal stress protein [Sphingobacterium sp. SYP-B4668]
MKKILFPTDFSPTANNAFIYALHIADTLRAELYVLHAYLLPIVSERRTYPESRQDVTERLISEKTNEYIQLIPVLDKLVEASDRKHIKRIYMLEQGTVVSAIEKVLSQEEFDLVIMGTTGASGYEKKFLGSNTVNVMNMVQKPLLCIPHSARYEGIYRFGFTTIFKEVDFEILRRMIPIANLFHAQIKCVHVSAYADAQLLETISRWGHILNTDVVDISLILSDSTKESILDFVESSLVDILVMVKRNRGFFSELFQSSMSHEVTYSNQIPVWVFQE